ncbi:MAG: PIN domain-containing protein [Candidatus Diapherotrites archaeon]
MRVFVDTNIFLDYYFDRKDSIKPLGEFAFNFFRDALKCKFSILLCNPVIRELEKTVGLEKIGVFKSHMSALKLAGKLEIIEETTWQVSEAQNLNRRRGLPLNDCIIAVMARDQGVSIVTRDMHFWEFGFITALTPEELL